MLRDVYREEQKNKIGRKGIKFSGTGCQPKP